jgi:hypothetical protein
VQIETPSMHFLLRLGLAELAHPIEQNLDEVFLEQSG